MLADRPEGLRACSLLAAVALIASALCLAPLRASARGLELGDLPPWCDVKDSVPKPTARPFVAVIVALDDPTVSWIGASSARGACFAYGEYRDKLRERGIDVYFIDVPQEKARSVGEELAGNPNALAVIGSVGSNEMEVLLAATRAQPLPWLMALATHSALDRGPADERRWIFRVSLTDDAMVETALKRYRSFARRERGVVNYTLLYEEEALGSKGVKEDFELACDKRESECNVAAFDIGKRGPPKNYAELIRNSVRADTSVVGLICQSRDAVLLLKELRKRERELGAHWFVFSASANSDQDFSENAGEDADGVEIFTGFSPNGNVTSPILELLGQFSSRYRVKPDSYAAQSADAARVLMEALDDEDQRAPFEPLASAEQSADARARLRDQIANTQISGWSVDWLSFADGRLPLATRIYVWKSGALLPVGEADDFSVRGKTTLTSLFEKGQAQIWAALLGVLIMVVARVLEKRPQFLGILTAMGIAAGADLAPYWLWITASATVTALLIHLWRLWYTRSSLRRIAGSSRTVMRASRLSDSSATPAPPPSRHA